jgi:hypothetical protein
MHTRPPTDVKRTILDRRASWLIAVLLLFVTGPASLHAQADDSGPDTARQPVPTQAEQQRTLAAVRDIFWESYQASKTSQQKIDVAKKILAQSSKTSKAVERFVLLRVARDIASREADYRTAFEAIDQLDRQFQIDSLAMKAATLEKAALPPGRVRELSKVKALTGLELLEEALTRDEYELAERLVAVATDAAWKSREADVRRKAALAKKVVEERLAKYQPFAAARAKLQESPTDAQANGVVGAYHCFEKGDWNKGIPCLALADDAPLRAAAQQDMKAQTDEGGEVAAGDAWWDLAAKASGTRRQAMRARAKYWYQQVLPSLDGLDAVKLEQRLATLKNVDLSPWLAVDRPARPADTPPATTVPANPEGSWGGSKFGPFPDDPWDVRQGVRVLRHSPLTPSARPPYDIRGLFGYNQPVSLVIFQRAAAGFVHFVEWETAKPMTLRSFLFKAGHDANGERTISRFRLFAQDVNTGKLVQVYQFDPVVPYRDIRAPQHATVAHHGKETFLLRVNVRPVTAQRFRAEFVQGDDGTPNPAGAKVMDLDGFEGFHPELSHPD